MQRVRRLQLAAGKLKRRWVPQSSTLDTAYVFRAPPSGASSVLFATCFDTLQPLHHILYLPRQAAPSSNASSFDSPPKDNEPAETQQLRLLRSYEASGVVAKAAGFAAWLMMLWCWASLIWLPALAIKVGLKLRRSGPTPALVAAAVSIAGIYLKPFISGEWSGGADGCPLMLRGWLNWFRSVELWVHESALQRQDPTLYCYHPHGVFTVGATALLLGGKELFPNGLVAMGSEYISYFGPLLTQLIKSNCPTQLRFQGVSRASFHKVLGEGHDAVIMVPGGIQEATLTSSGSERLYLQSRKGFVKYALQYGYNLTPIYAFGETDAFHNLQGGMSWRLRLNKGMFGMSQGLPTVLPMGWGWFPVVPDPAVRIRIVVGAPLELPHIHNPSSDDVERWHKEYVRAVRDLYDAGVQQTGAPARQLEVM